MRPQRPGPRPTKRRRAGSQPRSRRFAALVPVELSVLANHRRLNDHGARLQDLSQTGVFVRSDLRPSIGRSAVLRFRCGGSQCVAAGFVVSLRPGRGFAVQIEGANGAFDTLFAELSSVRDAVSRSVLQMITRAELSII